MIGIEQAKRYHAAAARMVKLAADWRMAVASGQNADHLRRMASTAAHEATGVYAPGLHDQTEGWIEFSYEYANVAGALLELGRALNHWRERSNWDRVDGVMPEHLSEAEMAPITRHLTALDRALRGADAWWVSATQARQVAQALGEEIKESTMTAHCQADLFLNRVAEGGTGKGKTRREVELYSFFDWLRSRLPRR